MVFMSSLYWLYWFRLIWLLNLPLSLPLLIRILQTLCVLWAEESLQTQSVAMYIDIQLRLLYY